MRADNWYVFFVKTGQEKKAADEIKDAVKDDKVTHIELLVETLFRTKGKVNKETKSMFPGYIFIATEIGNDEFISRTTECSHRSKVIIKLLRYGNTSQAAVAEEEREALECLAQDNYCVKASKGFLAGDRIVVTEGPFAGRESTIKEIRQHKMQAVIEVEFMGSIRRATVGLEIVERLAGT